MTAYPMSDDVRGLYDSNWSGPNLASALAAYREPEDWLDEVVSTVMLAKAASKDLLTNDEADWPNHPVYARVQGFGMLHASVWDKHESKIRQFLGAKRPDFYLNFAKDDPNKVADPAARTNASSIVELLRVADKETWRDVRGIRMTEPSWGAYIVTVVDVRPHGENLTIVTPSEGHEVIANRREDGSFRWSVGEPCVYVPEGAIVPDDVLQERGYWDDAKGKGLLEGKKGNRVKMRRMAGFESRGLLLKVGSPGENPSDERAPTGAVGWIDRGDHTKWVSIDDDVTEFFGLTEHVAG